MYKEKESKQTTPKTNWIKRGNTPTKAMTWRQFLRQYDVSRWEWYEIGGELHPVDMGTPKIIGKVLPPFSYERSLPDGNIVKIDFKKVPNYFGIDFLAPNVINWRKGDVVITDRVGYGYVIVMRTTVHYDSERYYPLDGRIFPTLADARDYKAKHMKKPLKYHRR